MAAREVFRGARPLGDVTVDSPGVGEHVYTARARDGLGNIGPESPPSAVVRVVGDFDGGDEPPVDGGDAPRQRELGIGCGCAASPVAPLLLLVLCSWASTFRRRSPRRATRGERRSSS